MYVCFQIGRVRAYCNAPRSMHLSLRAGHRALCPLRKTMPARMKTRPAQHRTLPKKPALRFSVTPRQSSGKRVLVYQNSRPRTGSARPRPACAGRGPFSKNCLDYSWTVTDWSSNSATSWRATVSSMPMVLAASSNMTIQNGQATAMVSGCSVRSCSRRMTLVFLSP